MPSLCPDVPVTLAGLALQCPVPQLQRLLFAPAARSMQQSSRGLLHPVLLQPALSPPAGTLATYPSGLQAASSGVLSPAGWSSLASSAVQLSLNGFSTLLLGSPLSASSAASTALLPPFTSAALPPIAGFHLTTPSTTPVPVLLCLMVLDARGSVGVAWGSVSALSPLSASSATTPAALDGLTAALLAGVTGGSGATSAGGFLDFYMARC
jgi:hypothetical protein